MNSDFLPRLLFGVRFRFPPISFYFKCCLFAFFLVLFVIYTRTSFIIMSITGRLPASGLGAQRPEQHILVHVCSVSIDNRSFSLSPTRSLSPSLSSPRARSAQMGFPLPASRCDPILSLPFPPLPLFIRTSTPLAQSVFHRELHRHPPPGPFAIKPSSAHLLQLLPSSTRFIDVTIRPSDVALGCRLCPGHQHQRHRFWCSVNKAGVTPVFFCVV